MPNDTPGATNGVPAAIPDLNADLRFSRADAMAAMHERRREVLAKEMGPNDPNTALLGLSPPGVDPAAVKAAVTDDDDTSGADAAADAERKRLAAEADAAAAAAEAAAAPKANDNPDLDPTKQTQAQAEFIDLTDDDLKHVRIRHVVNGVEETISGEEMRRRAQKTGAADDYLEQTRALLHEVKALRAGTSVVPSATPTETTPAAKPAASDAERAAQADAVIDLMYVGELDAAKVKLRELMAAPSAKPVDVDAAIDAALKLRVIKDGLRQFRETHKDLVADPIARKLADEFLYQDLAKRGATRLEDLPTEDIVGVLNGAGKSAEAWISQISGGGSLGGGTGGVTANTLRDRLNRKKSSDELPTAALRSSSGESAAKSVTDKLNDMRRARGQPVA